MRRYWGSRHCSSGATLVALTKPILLPLMLMISRERKATLGLEPLAEWRSYNPRHDQNSLRVQT